MISINPLDVFFWTFRRNEKDVVNLYSTLSPVMQLTTGGTMLNFGYWSSEHSEPILAQNNLCDFFGDFAELSSGKNVVDVGSGLSAPSKLWKEKFSNINLYDVNINFKQLTHANRQQNIELLNSTSTKLPFADNSVDRVLALESAQHFKPISDFFNESKRILQKSGLLAIAIPVTNGSSAIDNLGLLKFTWSSEHYSVSYLKNIVSSVGFSIIDEQMIGSNVYEPLADYYFSNRKHLREKILKTYPSYLETILFKSLQKMKKASEKKVIDYLLLKCSLN